MSVWLMIAAWLSLFGVEAAWGQIYKWVDRQGNVLFTDNPSHIPAEYRSKVEVEMSSPAAPLPIPGNETTKVLPTEAATPADIPTAPPSKDRLGQGPDYWQQLVRHWSGQLQQQIEALARLQQLHDFTRALANSTRDASARRRLEAEIVRLEMAVAEANTGINKAPTMLQTTLPLEARRLGANLEWLKLPMMTQP